MKGSPVAKRKKKRFGSPVVTHRDRAKRFTASARSLKKDFDRAIKQDNCSGAMWSLVKFARMSARAASERTGAGRKTGIGSGLTDSMTVRFKKMCLR